ncbi:MAG: XdhC family protein [Acidobacteriota bacterium]|nr:XdhC family protein [Acidobacteriota bacterium]
MLVSLVQAAGSSYRRRGARLLVGDSGGYVGTGGYVGISSGGCLEGEVVRKAGWMVR